MRVVVADDAMLIREGLTRLLARRRRQVVGKASDAAELLRHVQRAQPDVAIVDIRMPPTHTDEGLVAAERIRAEHPDVGVLVLSQYVDARLRAARCSRTTRSASATCSRSASSTSRVLVDALRRIAEGECVIDPTIVAQLVGAPRADSPLDELTRARARGARADRRGPLQPGDRRAAGRSARRRSRATCTRSS